MDIKPKHITIGGAVFCGALAMATVFIPAHEGDELKSYQDIGGVWTACGGVTGIPAHSSYTAQQCAQMTNSTIGKFMVQVAGVVPAETPAETLAAYTSFAYNIGIVGFTHSTTLKLANEHDIPGSCEAMLKWYMAGGKDCRIRSNNCYGVYQRRQDERDLCLKGVR